MKSKLARISFPLLALHLSLSWCNAAQFVIIARSGANSWAFYDAETVKVNNRDKLRLGSTQKLALAPDEYKHLPSQPLQQLGPLRRHANGYLVRKQNSGWEPVAPDGLNVNSKTNFGDLWKSVTVIYQADRASKTVSHLRSDEVVFAILRGSDRDQTVTDFLADETNYLGVGEADREAAFAERMALLKFASQKLTPPAEKLQQILLSKMIEDRTKVSGGIAHRADLVEGLEYAKVSAEAYPNEPRHQKCRKDLEDIDNWLKVRTSVLRTLAAGEQWDDFLAKYDDFDRWRNSYTDIGDVKERAFTASANQHLELGKKYESTKQWERALNEYKLARRYLPNNRELAGLIDKAKTESDHESVKAKEPDQTTPAEIQATRYLSKAKSEIADGKKGDLDNADQDIQDASRQSPASIRVLLARADLLRARESYQEARDLLDDYDRKASSPTDVTAGIDLRTQVEREYNRRVAGLKDAIKKAKDDGDYQTYAQSARDAAALDPRDLDFLHDAATASAVTRDLKDAAKYGAEHLKRLALTPGTTDAQISDAYAEQALYTHPPAEPQGAANWFSGYKSAADVFYCPISLMPNPRIKDIHAGRQVINFQWDRDRLIEIDRSRSEPPEKDGSLWFEYRADQPGVWRATDSKPDPKEERPTRYLFTAAGTVGTSASGPLKSNWNYFTLLNRGDLDPAMAKRLLGKQVAVLIAVNPYFQPFEWNGVYRFLAEYDDQGRVKSASLLSDDPVEAARYRYEFSWNGPELEKISGADYQRLMKYEGGKLVSETVSSHGRNSEIRYNWVNGRLVSAKSGEGAGGKSRDVTFQ